MGALRSGKLHDTISNMPKLNAPRIGADHLHNREFFNIECSPARHILDFRQLGLDPVRLLGRYHYVSAHQEIDAHSHGEMIEICYLESGQQTYEVNGKVFPLVGGDVFLTFPHELHGTGAHPEARGILCWLLISVPAARRSFLNLPPTEGRLFLKRLLQIPRRCFRGPRSLQATLHSIFETHADTRNPLRATELRNQLIRFLLDVVASAYKAEQLIYSPKISSVLDHIEKNFEQPLPLVELADIANLSLPRLKSKFKQEVGLPPATYLAHRRVEQAAKLLYETKRPIIDIAMELGFSSSQYFATVFKRYTRCSPRQARRARVLIH